MVKKLIASAVETDKRKIVKLVEGRSFDLLIMSLIFMDAIALGLMSTMFVGVKIAGELFVLDRLFMAIFIVEMLIKLYAYGPKFFKSGWNVFDFTVIAISSISMFGYFIVLRVFRLFRVLKYVGRFSRMRNIINTFILLIPNFLAMFFVLAVFFYVFAVIGVSLFGNIIVEFSTLGNSLFTLLQVFTLDGWAEDIARPVMQIFPLSWMFFVSFVFVSFLVVVSFLMNVIGELIEKKESNKIKNRL